MEDKKLQSNPFMTNMKYLQDFKEDTEFERILKLLTVPAKSGIYISRIDIQKMGKAFQVEIPVRERKEMLKDLFHYAKQMDKTIDLIQTLIDYVNYRIDQYKEIEENFPKSKKITDKWVKLAERTKTILENMKKEAEVLKDVY
ncbi:hypothetical protein [Hydrogenivirga sp. 128-5-R1-1]|uniref:hypothetical protein n=1 Tax=Hydrogenivirga sp. 128-5-R1-1 TaxID=392423 RepID=UPI00015EEF36|nr:hypothetical protein [Hydrogenivirga sp. 128-5-R1-1]EDP73538.1 hypothetical protein HG1285_10862 [Hydrogenivirga sp. 128-5-R1-1]